MTTRSELLETEEWHGLFLLSMEKASRVASESRIRAIATILAKSLSGEAGATVAPIDLVQVVGELTEPEALLLLLIGQLYSQHVPLLTNSRLFNAENLQSITPAQHRDAVPFLLSRLVGKGFLDTNFEYFNMASITSEVLSLFDETAE